MFQTPVEPAEPAITTIETTGQPPAVRWRELVALALLVALCDVTIYRGNGFAGYALLFAVAPAALWAASPWRRRSGYLWIIGAMLLALAVRLIWLGSALQVAIGFALLVGWTQCLCGMRPFVLEGAVFASQSLLAGYQGLVRHGRFLAQWKPPLTRIHGLSVALPLAAVLGFGFLFILANPDLVSMFSEGLSAAVDRLRDWLALYAPSPLEAAFWFAVFWIGIGLLRPVWRGQTTDPITEPSLLPTAGEAAMYPAVRNTLIAVSLLFAVYLVFEFQTLWFRSFPQGFYYAGYAHEGAAWLTVSLALATAVLSVLFQGRILRDPRLPALRRLAWLWSLENVLLAAAVYHRLLIYIGFNGLTRLRVVALFGISAVVAGFLLVFWKIARNREFIWLIRRQLWALAITVYLFALTPVDRIMVDHNVRRVLAGDLKPSVQLIAQPIGSEGVLRLQPLLQCPDAAIREGVRALLAQHDQSAEQQAQARAESGWTAFQIADRLLLEGLRAGRGQWAVYAGRTERETIDRDQALRRFRDYTNPWY